ncbi:MAG: ribonuclease [Shinella sp.]|nr:ribonuclease [Shinella sp.]
MMTKSASAFLFSMVSFLSLAGASAAQTVSEGQGEGGATRHVFAVSWQPGFCAISGNRPECRELAAGGAEASRFSLHGLWQVRRSYCGIDAQLQRRDRSGNWNELPKLALSEGTAKRLAVAMPGVKSGLDRHQWLRHGTCQASTAEDYFARSLDMLDVMNASVVRALFEQRIGGQLTIQEVREAFDQTFGPGAGERVRLQCRRSGERQVVTGLTVGLGGIDAGADDFGGLVHQAAATRTRCSGGEVRGVADRQNL